MTNVLFDKLIHFNFRMEEAMKNPVIELIQTKKGTNEQIRKLIGKDPKLLEMPDENGSTPLHHAAWNRDETAIMILLELGADKKAKNNKGSIPADSVYVAETDRFIYDPRALAMLDRLRAILS